MEAAQHAAGGVGEVVLHEAAGQAGLLVAPPVPGLHEEAALVSEHVRLDYHDAGEARLEDVHTGVSGFLSRSSRYCP